MNRSLILDFVFRNISECDKILTNYSFICDFMCSSQQKEVVDSRVESRVGNLIACYSFDFSRINVIFLFFFIYKHV